MRRLLPAALLTGLVLTGCGDDPASPDVATPTEASVTVTHTIQSTATATQTTTETETITETVTETETVTVTATVTQQVSAEEDWDSGGEAAAQEDDQPSPAAPARPTGQDDTDFHAELAEVCAGRIVRDISTVDERMRDGGAVSSALWLLSGQYDCLDGAGTPAGVDPADYHPRLVTLAEFADRAADEHWDDPLSAAATYSVIREQTAVVLDLLNSATGWSYQLP